jgi:hypothetical protein
MFSVLVKSLHLKEDGHHITESIEHAGTIGSEESYGGMK